jgi:hypothetical protein
MLWGILPVNILWATSNCSKLTICPMLSGRDPTSLLKLTSKTVRFFSNPISDGRQADKLLFKSMISLRVAAIFPRLGGTHPLRLLLAKTTTETGEFPRLVGISRWNLLLLTKMASRSLSNSFVGSGPSNSLNLMSKYFSEGRWRTTFGNGPANLLLLISSSCSRDIFLKLLGTIPQNLLVLIWNNARSVSRPSCVGRYPAMSAWFRSMPATTTMDLLYGGEEQNTPV